MDWVWLLYFFEPVFHMPNENNSKPVGMLLGSNKIEQWEVPSSTWAQEEWRVSPFCLEINQLPS
jgi:hypothetical protein